MNEQNLPSLIESIKMEISATMDKIRSPDDMVQKMLDAHVPDVADAQVPYQLFYLGESYSAVALRNALEAKIRADRLYGEIYPTVFIPEDKRLNKFSVVLDVDMRQVGDPDSEDTYIVVLIGYFGNISGRVALLIPFLFNRNGSLILPDTGEWIVASKIRYEHTHAVFTKLSEPQAGEANEHSVTVVDNDPSRIVH